MADAKEVGKTFAANLAVVRRQLEGLTHEECLIQPPFRGNCLNWVLGHIMVGRNRALIYLEQPPEWNEAQTNLYATGSAPITSSESALPLEDLKAALERSQERLVAALEAVDPEAWRSRLVPLLGRERPLGEAIAGLAWHETYHAGQAELLRQLAGKDDRVI